MSSDLQSFRKANLMKSGCKSSFGIFKTAPFHIWRPSQLLGYLGPTGSLYIKLISAAAYLENGSWLFLDLSCHQGEPAINADWGSVWEAPSAHPSPVPCSSVVLKGLALFIHSLQFFTGLHFSSNGKFPTEMPCEKLVSVVSGQAETGKYSLSLAEKGRLLKVSRWRCKKSL